MSINTGDELRRVLDQVTFAPSCLDMGWGWEVAEVMGRGQGALEGGMSVKGWHIKTTFQRPDTDTGEIGTGYGREWFVRKGDSASGVVKTAFLACKQIVEHELMEAFLYQSVRVFDPHADVADLIDLIDLNRRLR